MHSLHNTLSGHDVNSVGKQKQVHVLTDYLGFLLMCTTKGTAHGFLVSTEGMTGFTHEYLPLISIARE